MSSSKPTGWEQLGDYKLLGKFARGQSCALHLALYPGADTGSQLRAVKMPLPEYASDANFTNLLVGEAQLLACIQHPNVLAAHGFGRDRGGYVALDYVEGDDFQTLQGTSRRPPEPRIVLAIIADILQGLDALHTAVGEVGDPLRAVHQAPTARHILVGTDGRARLADFTHARVERPLSERRRSSRLELAYRAPEQIQAPDRVDARTDLFVLGIALWEALTGHGLFAAVSSEQTTQKVLSVAIAPPSSAGALSNAAIDQVCLRALARDPQQRWSSAKEMLLAVLDAGLAIGGIALPAEVGRWVSLQAAAQLQVRHALAGGMASEPSGRAPQTIPPPSAAFGRASPPDKPLDLSKTLMGTGLTGWVRPEPQRSEPQRAQPAPTQGSFQPTVLAETEPSKPPSFRPSRPSSSRPPGSNVGATASAATAANSAATSSSVPPNGSPAPVEARGAAREQNSPAPSVRADDSTLARGDARLDQSKRTSLLPSGGAPPAGAIDTEGVDLSPRPLSGRRGRITEEYAVSERPSAPSSMRSAPLARNEPEEARSRTTSPELATPSRPAPFSAGPSFLSEERSRGPASPAPAPATSSAPVAVAAPSNASAQRGAAQPTPSQATPSQAAKPARAAAQVDVPSADSLRSGADPRFSARTSAPGPEAPRGSHPPGSGWRPGRNDLVWMSLFAVFSVLAGDGMIRLWFGSPYGEPQVPPIAAARDAAKPQ